MMPFSMIMTIKFFGRIDESVIHKPYKLDAKDRKIISFLLEDCRMPLTRIAKSVRLSRDAVEYRIRKLCRDRIITGFVPLLQLKNLGFNKYHTFFLLNEKKKERQKQLFSYLEKHPNVRSVMEYSGRWDIEFVIVAKNVYSYETAINDIENRFSDVIMDKKRLPIIWNYHSVHLPYAFYKKFGEPLITNKVQKEVKIDKNDIRILEMLCRNARLSTYKISKKVGLSPDAITYRINKMKDAGIILLFTAVLNLSGLGYQWYTLVLRIETMDKRTLSRFREFVSRHDYIIRAVKTLGVDDIMIYIVTDSNNAFHATIKSIKHEFGDIIDTYRIYPGYKEHFYIPIPRVVSEKYYSRG